MLSVTETSEKQIERLAKAIDGNSKRLKKELAIAVNATAKKAKNSINAQVRKELAVKKSAVDRVIEITDKADAKDKRPRAKVTLKQTGRLSLKEFGARQVKKGVSYKVSKTAGRRYAPGAFMGPRPGAVSVRLRGHVFLRETKSRLPIRKLWGASPWGAFVKRKMTKTTERDTSRELRKQIERRINFINLKKSGQI